MTLKETLKEMKRLKSNCSAKSSIYVLLMVRCLSLLFRHGNACAPNPCTELMPETTGTNDAIMRYTKSLTPSPTVARNHHGSLLLLDLFSSIASFRRILSYRDPWTG